MKETRQKPESVSARFPQISIEAIGCRGMSALHVARISCMRHRRPRHGHPAFSEVILDQQLSPHAAAVLLRMSAAKDGMSLAVIVLAAGTARHMADPHGWNGETERLLALEALHDDAALKRAAYHAAKIVAEDWLEIATES